MKSIKLSKEASQVIAAMLERAEQLTEAHRLLCQGVVEEARKAAGVEEKAQFSVDTSYLKEHGLVFVQLPDEPQDVKPFPIRSLAN
jgi:hypothetical protein